MKQMKEKRSSILDLGCAMLALVGSGAVHSATLSAVHTFKLADGSHAREFSILAQGRDGNIYGTTPEGGSYGYGTAFKLTPEGAFTKLHDFDGINDGRRPDGGLTLGKDGYFYGTSSRGGAFDEGVVFKMTPVGAITVLHHFGPIAPSGRGDGRFPASAPIQGRDGNLYGTTFGGGAYGSGTIYKISRDGTFALLFSFLNDPSAGLAPLGYYPRAPLLQGRDGALYGTTTYGTNATGSGVVFRVTTGGAASTLYAFRGSDGAYPHGPLVEGTDGNLYGTTSSGGSLGGGTVYKLTKAGMLTTLHEFASSSIAGYSTYAGLVQASNGNFYGVTSTNSKSGAGKLFEVTPSGGYTQQASFGYQPGATPYATPFLHTNGKIYGLTYAGSSFGHGAVYSVDLGAPGLINAVPSAAKAGATVVLLGAVADATGVSFGGENATFSGTGSTYRTAVVPKGAATGHITLMTPTGSVQTLKPFLQLPTLSAFSPAGGTSGSSVLLTGTGLMQTTKVTFGGGKVATFVVNTDTQVTVTVPAGAATGKIRLTTLGGTVGTATAFAVTP